MIELIDQSDPNSMKFRCTSCQRVFVQRSFGQLELHTPVWTSDARKAGIPPCQPIVSAVSAEPEAPIKRASHHKSDKTGGDK
jgi:hypothetical protein